jgi:hypothetical protein
VTGTGATVAAPTGGRGRAALLALLAVTVVVQLVVLYAPEGAGEPSFPQSDKVVHAVIFAVPVAIALLAGLPRGMVVAVFAANAVLSEVVQAVLLPHRSGDPMDAVADLAGVGLGVLAAHVALRWATARGGRAPSR